MKMREMSREDEDLVMFMGFFPLRQEGYVTNGKIHSFDLPFEVLRRYFIPDELVQVSTK